MTVKIHSDYEHLKEIIENIPSGMLEGDQVLRANRNLLYKTAFAGAFFAVKRYKRPNLFNRFVYTFIRKTKARRSYEYAEQLLGLGIGTAAPVAYIEIKKHGLFESGYFISEFISEPLLSGVEGHPDQEKILYDFAGFSADMHRKRIFHGDYNADNIFFRREGDGYRFFLIDNNRIRFKKPTQRRCSDDLKRLKFSLPLQAHIFEQYALKQGWNPEIFCGRVFLKRGVDFPGRLKRELRNLFKERKNCKMIKYAHR